MPDFLSRAAVAQPQAPVEAEVPMAVPLGEAVRGKNGGTLRPFRPGDPRASVAGRKGVEARRAKRVAAQLGTLRPWRCSPRLVPRSNVRTWASLAATAAIHLMGEVVAGRQRVRDPAAWVRVLVDIARLEEGRATSLTASVQAKAVTADDVKRAIELRDVARRAIVERSSWRGFLPAASEASEVLESMLPVVLREPGRVASRRRRRRSDG